MPPSGAAGRCGRIRPMSSASFDYEQVTRVTAGAIGQPGKREFYLQLRAGGQLVSLALEKDQLRALTERLQEVFTRVPVPPAGSLPGIALSAPVTALLRGRLHWPHFPPGETEVEVPHRPVVGRGGQTATPPPPAKRP